MASTGGPIKEAARSSGPGAGLSLLESGLGQLKLRQPPTELRSPSQRRPRSRPRPPFRWRPNANVPRRLGADRLKLGSYGRHTNDRQESRRDGKRQSTARFHYEQEERATINSAMAPKSSPISSNAGASSGSLINEGVISHSSSSSAC
jgi:hypothetical protein